MSIPLKNKLGIVGIESIVALLLFSILFSIMILWMGNIQFSLTHSYQLLARSCTMSTFQEFFFREIRQLPNNRLSAIIVNGTILRLQDKNGNTIDWYHHNDAIVRAAWSIDIHKKPIKQVTTVLTEVPIIRFTIIKSPIKESISHIIVDIHYKYGEKTLYKSLFVPLRIGSICT